MRINLTLDTSIYLKSDILDIEKFEKFIDEKLEEIEELDVFVTGTIYPRIKATLWEQEEGGHVEDITVYYKDIEVTEYIHDSSIEKLGFDLGDNDL